MTITPDSLKADLAGLAKSGAHAAESDRKINAAAAERRDAVEARLDELRTSGLALDSDEYQSLILERGRLDTLLGG